MTRHSTHAQASCKLEMGVQMCMLCLPWPFQICMQQLHMGLQCLSAFDVPSSLLICPRLFRHQAPGSRSI